MVSSYFYQDPFDKFVSELFHELKIDHVWAYTEESCQSSIKILVSILADSVARLLSILEYSNTRIINLIV